MESEELYVQSVTTFVKEYDKGYYVNVIQQDKAPNCEIDFEYSVLIDVGNDMVIKGVTGTLNGSRGMFCIDVLKKMDVFKGKKIQPGIIKFARSIFAGNEGCVHLRNMLCTGLNMGYRWGSHLRLGREEFIKIVNEELPGTCFGWREEISKNLQKDESFESIQIEDGDKVVNM